MEMQRSSTHSIQHQQHLSQALDDAFGCSHPAAAQQTQVETFELPRRSKQQNSKLTMGKKIFPWMKESRHANQKLTRRITGLYDTTPDASPTSKRTRTAYTSAQLVELEKEFHFSRYLCAPRRAELARLLQLHERQVKIWFQNRRMKQKKDERAQGRTSTSSSSPPSSPSAPGSPTLSSLGYVHLGGDYQPASPPLRSQAVYPENFTHNPHTDAQYHAHTANLNLEMSYFPESCSAQDRILQAPKLTHL
ncbi:unnamed protein product [Lampetra planeri]